MQFNCKWNENVCLSTINNPKRDWKFKRITRMKRNITKKSVREHCVHSGTHTEDTQNDNRVITFVFTKIYTSDRTTLCVFDLRFFIFFFKKLFFCSFYITLLTWSWMRIKWQPVKKKTWKKIYAKSNKKRQKNVLKLLDNFFHFFSIFFFLLMLFIVCCIFRCSFVHRKRAVSFLIFSDN